MCGLAGIISREQPVSPARLEKLSVALARRGPDGQGIWQEGRAGLVHRRLALVDLSPTGAQPMADASGRYQLVFNGEIYNYLELRAQLEQQGARFVSHSDTEVLLELYRRDGELCLNQLRGMFAFAIWDREEQRLFFARDRIGKKPFFYRATNAEFSFASEIKTLQADQSAEIDLGALRLFFGLQYVPSPRTGFLGIASLEPGHCGTWKDGQLEIRSYHTFFRSQRWSGTYEEAKQEMRRRLEDSVAMRLRADVPVGIFLSGGMDSSVIAALMKKQQTEPLQAFTMGFEEQAYDERKEAAQFARYLGAAHHQFEATADDILTSVDEVLAYYDAPYADSSCLPTWLLAKATKIHVKAVLTGDGGDEVFGGYTRYRYWLLGRQLVKFGMYPVIALAARASSDPRLQRFNAFVQTFAKQGVAAGYAELFRGSYFTSQEEERLLQPDFRMQTETDAAAHLFTDLYQQIGGRQDFAMNADLLSYLPDDLNVKMDRATMAHGLEARCPFLDQEVVEFAGQLPIEWHLNLFKKKPFLQSLASDLLPPDIWRRPKRGFRVPLASWFRGPLRSAFLEQCLTTGPLDRICQKKQIEQILEENDRGKDRGNALWMLFSLAKWVARNSV